MINGIAAQHNNSQPKCEVCDSLLTYPDFLVTSDLDYSVCRAFDCRRIMGQKSTMAPLFFKSHLEFNRKLIRQRRERDAAKKKYIDEITEKETQEHRELFQSALNEYTGLSEESAHLLVIPSGFMKSVESTNERLNRYIEHLKTIVSEASNYTSVSGVNNEEHHNAYGKRVKVDQRFDDNPKLRTISDKLCCMCKGGCCVSGKEHAYLSVFSMRRFMDENPDMSAEKVLGLYLSKISLDSIENSCINNIETGCKLPRHMRSDICNGYYCDSLKRYQKKMLGSERPTKVIAIQRSYTYWNRFEPGINSEIVDVALVDENKYIKLNRSNQPA